MNDSVSTNEKSEPTTAHAKNEQQPLASVVVCVYNRPHDAIRCIDSLLSQEYTPYEIIVIDDASCDLDQQALHHYISRDLSNKIQLVIHDTNQGLSASRNHAISLARGDFIAFIGPDCTAGKDWLTHLLTPILSNECVAASGVVIDVGGSSWADLAIRGATNIVAARNCGRPLIGNNMAFRGDVLRRFCFDIAMTLYADEDDLARRLIKAGYKIGFAPDAIVYHNHPMTVAKYLRQAWLQGQGSAYYWWKHRIFIGRDILFLVLAIVTLPLIIMGWPATLVPPTFFTLHVAAHIFNERFLKGKSWLITFYVLPLIIVYTLIKATSWTCWWVRVAVNQSAQKSS